MSAAKKSISAINAKLKKGEAVVMTAMDFKKEVRNGHRFKVEEVDVVTTGTRGVMSGTSAMLVVPMAPRGAFSKARKMWLNGVPCITGSNPEEGSGLVDTVIYGTEESRDNPGRYGGGNVMRDFVEGKEIEAECLTAEGKVLTRTITLEHLSFARIYSFRNGYQNYMAFVNAKNHPSYKNNPTSIFACRPVPVLKGMSMSGSGELNPLENDPRGRIIRPGMNILVNGALGTIIGFGTRSQADMRCLSICADMFGMDPQFMGGFKTSYGIEVTNGLAVPFPILDQQVIDDLSKCLDETIPMKIGDLGDRIMLRKITYADVWRKEKLEVQFDPERCICCSFQCPAEYYCPMGAISWKDKTIDETRCVACGACTANCLGGAFMGKDEQPRGNIGVVRAFEREIPVIFRQANRFRAEMLATRLKEFLEAGQFLLAETDLSCRHWNQ